MKIFIKLLFVAVILTVTAESYAQTFGLRAGVNFANMLVKDEDETYSEDFKMNPGFHIGPTAEFPINDIFSFETGLIASTKGFKIDESESGFDYKLKANLIYLDIPLTAKASYDVNFGKIYGAVGPYLGMGLIGKYKSEMSFGGETETDTEDVEWGSGEDADLKRLDYGLTVGAGVEINGIQVGLSYGLGLANTSPDSEGDYKASHRVLSVSIGYKFGAK